MWSCLVIFDAVLSPSLSLCLAFSLSRFPTATGAEIVINKHWNPASGSFAVIPLAEKTDSDADAATTESPRPATTRPIGHEGDDPMPPNCNLSAIRVVNQTVVSPQDPPLYPTHTLSI